MLVLANGEAESGVEAARRSLLSGRSALDAVEAGARVVEADPRIHSVGLGGRPSVVGQVECDAGIMDGRTLQAGAVAALQGYIHAISVARQVLERLPHTFLAGAGASMFAREIGSEPAEMLTPAAHEEHQRWLRAHAPGLAAEAWSGAPLIPHAWTSARTLRDRGTAVLLAIDARGDIAAGASSSGWAGKYPGRVGDSAVVGAGVYADNRYGACACTHTGEMTIRVGTARSVVLYMKRGASVEEACREAVLDLGGLVGGYIGPVVVHAIDAVGASCVVATERPDPGVFYVIWTPDRDGVVTGEPRVIGSSFPAS